MNVCAQWVPVALVAAIQCTKNRNGTRTPHQHGDRLIDSPLCRACWFFHGLHSNRCLGRHRSQFEGFPYYEHLELLTRILGFVWILTGLSCYFYLRWPVLPVVGGATILLVNSIDLWHTAIQKLIIWNGSYT